VRSPSGDLLTAGACRRSGPGGSGVARGSWSPAPPGRRRPVCAAAAPVVS